MTRSWHGRTVVDAVSDRLPVAVGQRDIGGEIDAGARHHLPFECVAMQVDDPGQHLQASGIDPQRNPAMARAGRGDLAVRDLQAGFEKLAAEQRPAAFYSNVVHGAAVGHGAALRLGRGDRLTVVAASYFARKSSTVNLREIGQRPAQRFMAPVPPGQLRQPAGHLFGKPPPDRPRRIARDDGVGRHVLGDDGAGCDHGAGADAAARQHDGAMPDPDVVTDMDAV